MTVEPGRAVASEGIAGYALDAAPDGVIVVASGGVIVYANEAMNALVGGDGPVTGRHVDELVPDAVRGQHADLRRRYEDAPTRRPMGSGLELSMRRADGTELPVEISLSPYDGADGLYVVGVVRDVAERRENQRRLAAADRQVALLSERERIGRDLHDVVLQRLYGTGLTVQAIGAGLDSEAAARLDGVIDEIDRIIAEVRTIVFTLGNSSGRGNLGQELADVIAQSSRVLGFSPALRMEGPVESVLSDEIRVEMIASLREALGNVARHAGAHAVDVRIAVVHGSLELVVLDDGVGPPDDPAELSGGHGLTNLQTRAAVLGGTCVLMRRDVGGAALRWTAPY
ncbi:MAG: PAS domain S-box protein [Ilumatobacter sp.]|nr:PAS domain S-box protein [Ilumatobacter sp.]